MGNAIPGFFPLSGNVDLDATSALDTDDSMFHASTRLNGCKHTHLDGRTGDDKKLCGRLKFSNEHTNERGRKVIERRMKGAFKVP